MAQIHWLNQVNADFNTAADWTGGTVPGAGDDAILDATGGAFTVTTSTAEAVNSIQLASNATLDINARTFTAFNGTGSGKNAGTINIENNAYAALGGTVNNSGAITLDSVGNDTRLLFIGPATLSGGGKLTLTDNANNTVQANSSGDSLTNIDNTISGSGFFGFNNLAFTNSAKGVVDATGGAALVINTGTSVAHNAGLMEGTGAAGLLIQNTTVANTGTLLATNGSAVNLQGADIQGGTLATSGTGAVQTNANDRSSTLDGTAASVSNTGVLDVTNNAWLFLQGTIANAKGATINMQSVGNDTRIIVTASNATITGGSVILSDNGANTIQGTVGGPSGMQVASTLTNKTTISGAGLIGNVSLTLVNAKTIDATGATALIIDVGGGNFASSSTVTNTGLLEATNPGALKTTGGLLLHSETIANGTAGVIEANGAVTHVDLQSATIAGGTFVTAGGGVIETAGNDRGSVLDGTVNAVNNTGVLNVTNNAWLYVQGTINNTGSINLQSIGNDTRLRMNANTVLTGGGPIVLSDNGANTIEGIAAAVSLTNVSSTISGAGLLGNASLTFINDAAGVVDATGASNALHVDTSGQTLTNLGLLEATGAAGMVIQSTVVDDTGGGVISAGNGSAVSLLSSTIEGGTLATAGSGVIQTAANDRGGILDGTSKAVNNTGVFNVTNNAFLYLQGTIVNTGSINLQSSGNDTRLRMNANTVLTGGGPIVLSDNGANTIDAVTAALTLTNVDNTISGSGTIDGVTVINQAKGTIDSTGAAGLLLATGAQTVTNTGLIEATGAGGLLIQNSTINGSTGGTILAANGSHVSLQGADIVGGTLKTQGTGVVQTAANDRGSLLDGATFTLNNAATVNVTNNAFLYIQGTINNTGSINLLSAGNDTRLRLNANTTLTGNGVIFLNGAVNNTFDGVSAGLTLTNNGNTLEGSGLLFGSNVTLINNAGGVVDGTGTTALVLSTPGNTITNAGLLEGTGTGGLTVSGIVANTGGTVSAAAGSNVTLAGATLTGGTFTTAAGGQIVIGDGSTATIDAVSANAGTIFVDAVKTTAKLIFDKNASLTGGGTLSLSANAKNYVEGTKGTITLTNIDNTITGSGQLGAGKLTLINDAAGVIDAKAPPALVINTGKNTITNAGLIETTGKGSLTIKSAVANTGTIEANGGTLTLDATVTGSGVTIAAGTIDIANVGAAEAVAFTGKTGKLELAQSQSYSGSVTGFSLTGKTSLDLRDIVFDGTTTVGYSGTATSGTLTVTHGVQVAHITLVGNYLSSVFTLSSDGKGGTTVVDPQRAAAATAPAHAFVAAMAGLETRPVATAQLGAVAWRSPASMLARPAVQIA